MTDPVKPTTPVTTVKPVVTPPVVTPPIESKEPKVPEETTEFTEYEPEVKRITRAEFLDKVHRILQQHASDSNSVKKAYAEIEALVPD